MMKHENIFSMFLKHLGVWRIFWCLCWSSHSLDEGSAIQHICQSLTHAQSPAAANVYLIFQWFFSGKNNYQVSAIYVLQSWYAVHYCTGTASVKLNFNVVKYPKCGVGQDLPSHHPSLFGLYYFELTLPLDPLLLEFGILTKLENFPIHTYIASIMVSLNWQ